MEGFLTEIAGILGGDKVDARGCKEYFRVIRLDWREMN